MMQPNISSPYRPLLIRDVVYDKLDHPSLNCNDAADIKFTPPQGIILGGLVELYRGTGNTALLDIADAIANATIDQTRTSERMVYQQGSPHQGVLREDFEEAFACHDPSKQTCVSDDQVKFRWAPCNPATDPRKCVVIDVLDDPLSMSKGVFVRHLRTLYDQNQALGRSTYKWASFFRRQRESLIAHARVGTADFGYFWTGPVTKVDFVTQASAIDALTAALGL